MSENTSNILYYSLIHSHLCYGLLLWGMTYKTYVNQIAVLEKRALRIISISELERTNWSCFQICRNAPTRSIVSVSLGDFMFLQYRCRSPVAAVDYF